MHRFANPNPDEMAYKGRSDSYGSSKLYNIQHAQFLQERAKTEGKQSVHLKKSNMIGTSTPRTQVGIY